MVQATSSSKAAAEEEEEEERDLVIIVDQRTLNLRQLILWIFCGYSVRDRPPHPLFALGRGFNSVIVGRRRRRVRANYLAFPYSDRRAEGELGPKAAPYARQVLVRGSGNNFTNSGVLTESRRGAGHWQVPRSYARRTPAP